MKRLCKALQRWLRRQLPRTAYVRVRESASGHFIAWGGIAPLVAQGPCHEPPHAEIYVTFHSEARQAVLDLINEMRCVYNLVGAQIENEAIFGGFHMEQKTR